MALFNMTGLVLKWLLRRPYTRCYPTEPRQPLAGSRGTLQIDIASCIYCSICAKKCPTQAIDVDRAARCWTIDRLRCITCNYCVEACPKKCLTLITAHGIPTVTKDKEVVQGAPAPAPAPAAARTIGIST